MFPSEKEDNHLTVFGFLVLLALFGLISYHKSKDREAYMECLRVTEQLLREDPNRLSTPYCRL